MDKETYLKKDLSDQYSDMAKRISDAKAKDKKKKKFKYKIDKKQLAKAMKEFKKRTGTDLQETINFRASQYKTQKDNEAKKP